MRENFFEKRSWGHLTCTGRPRKLLYPLPLPRHSEASSTIILRDPTTTQADSRPWHCYRAGGLLGSWGSEDPPTLPFHSWLLQSDQKDFRYGVPSNRHEFSKAIGKGRRKTHKVVPLLHSSYVGVPEKFPESSIQVHLLTFNWQWDDIRLPSLHCRDNSRSLWLMLTDFNWTFNHKFLQIIWLRGIILISPKFQDLVCEKSHENPPSV